MQHLIIAVSYFVCMINIRLNPTVFAPGGKFFGFVMGRTVLSIGTGKEEAYMAKPDQVFGMDSLSYRGGQSGLLIDTTGTQISNDTLQYFMNNMEYVPAIGSQILDYQTRGLIIVDQDGVALTTAQLKGYTAP